MTENKSGDENFALGKNPVLECFRAGKTVERLFLQEGLHDEKIQTILREAKRQNTVISTLPKEKLDLMAKGTPHQGIIARVSDYGYTQLDEILSKAREKGHSPFLILLDEIEDPHNLGAIIRTANGSGADGLVVTKHRSAPLSVACIKASAGAVNYTPIARVANLAQTIEELKKQGMWFVCADMSGDEMYDVNMTGSIGLVLGNEGKGVSRLVKEKCDMVARIPMAGEISSLNVSVSCGVIAYEIYRQRNKSR